MKRLAALPFCIALSASAASTAPAAWPQITLPKTVSPFSAGERITLNGIPMQLTGFLSATPPEQLADWFRRSLGQPLAENRMGKTLILGKPSGDYYLTVQLETAGRGSRGIAAVTHMKGIPAAREGSHGAGNTWLQHLPSGSRVVSQMLSEDQGKASLQMVVINDQSEQANRDRLADLLQEDGLVLEQESRAADAPAPYQPERLNDARALYFKGGGKEAMATIARNRRGRAVIVLNIISRTGRTQ